MTPEQLHRKKLKELGYDNEHIEHLVNTYIKNCNYEFAEAYHTEQLKLYIVNRSTKINITEYQEYVNDILSSKERTTNFLIDTGIINEQGELTDNYKD